MNDLSWDSRSRTFRWRHNECDGVSNNRRLHCLLNCWFRRRSKKTSKLLVTSLCAGNFPVTGEFPAQKASNVENASIWWRHHDIQHNVTIAYSCPSTKYGGPSAATALTVENSGYQHGLTSIPALLSNCIYQDWCVELRIHSQTSTAVPLGMDKYFHTTLYNGCNYLSMLIESVQTSFNYDTSWHFKN